MDKERACEIRVSEGVPCGAPAECYVETYTSWGTFYLCFIDAKGVPGARWIPGKERKLEVSSS